MTVKRQSQPAPGVAELLRVFELRFVAALMDLAEGKKQDDS